MSRVGECELPSRNDRYLLYQTLVGVCEARVQGEMVPASSQPALPLGLSFPVRAAGCSPSDALVGRVCAYMDKCVKEAKEHTSWTEPSPAYERSVSEYVRGALTESFLSEAAPFLTAVAVCGTRQTCCQLRVS